MSALITNCCILRIDRHIVAGDGTTLFVTGVQLVVPVRAEAGAIQNDQRFTLGSTLQDASQVIDLFKDDWAAAGQDLPRNNDKLLVAIDGESADGVLMQIVTMRDNVMDDLSHWEIFLRIP